MNLRVAGLGTWCLSSCQVLGQLVQGGFSGVKQGTSHHISYEFKRNMKEVMIVIVIQYSSWVNSWVFMVQSYIEFWISECFIWNYLSRCMGWTTSCVFFTWDPNQLNHGLCWGSSIMWLHVHEHDDTHVLMIINDSTKLLVILINRRIWL